MLNAAARVVTGTWKFDRGLGQILHDELHWLDVPDLVFFKLAVTVHRCLNGRAPPYLSDYCVPAAGVDTRQHANRQLLAVPRYRLNTYGCRAFSVACPQSGTLSRISSETRPSVQTLSDVFLKHTCSLDTSAFSALEVLDDNRAPLIYLLTYLCFLCLGGFFTQMQKGMINAFLRKMYKYQFVNECFDINAIMADMDSILLKRCFPLPADCILYSLLSKANHICSVPRTITFSCQFATSILHATLISYAVFIDLNRFSRSFLYVIMIVSSYVF